MESLKRQQQVNVAEQRERAKTTEQRNAKIGQKMLVFIYAKPKILFVETDYCI